MRASEPALNDHRIIGVIERTLFQVKIGERR
jgi:hypothetical protein